MIGSYYMLQWQIKFKNCFAHLSQLYSRKAFALRRFEKSSTRCNHELGTTHDMYNTYIALLASWRARFMLAGLAFTTQLRLCISRSNLVDNLDLKAYYAKVSTKYFADQLCHSPTSSRSRVLKNEWTKTPSNNVPLSPRRSSDTNRCSSWISSVHTSENLNYHPRTRDPFFFC